VLSGVQLEGAGEGEVNQTMQRDMELVRAILLKMEEHETGFAPSPFEIEGFTRGQIGYHVYLMGQAGLLNVVNVTAHGDSGPSALPINLTWAGYEFIASSKNEATWKKATSTVMAKAGAIGFDLLKAALSAELKRQMGLQS
jgi:hypothetical protein